MAVVFISPKQRQKMFFWGITAVLLLFLLSFSATVFFAPSKEVATELVFNKPKVRVEMSVFENEGFKNLKPFSKMETQYKYKGFNKDKQPIENYITAPDSDTAQKKLNAMGYVITELTEVVGGRENPFTPYYSTASPEAAASKTATKNATGKTTTKK